MAIAYFLKKFDVFTFTPAIGDFFQPGKFPKTEAFFKRVQSDAEAMTDNAKDFYKRPRPFVTDPSLANGKLEKSYGYLSGHSTQSMGCSRPALPIYFPTSTTPSSPRRAASAGIAS